MERCIKESGINRGTVSFAWKELGGADYAALCLSLFFLGGVMIIDMGKIIF